MVKSVWSIPERFSSDAFHLRRYPKGDLAALRWNVEAIWLLCDTLYIDIMNERFTSRFVIIARFPRDQRSITADLFTRYALGSVVSLVSLCPASDPSHCSLSTSWVVEPPSLVNMASGQWWMDRQTVVVGQSEVAVDDLRQGLRSNATRLSSSAKQGSAGDSRQLYSITWWKYQRNVTYHYTTVNYWPPLFIWPSFSRLTPSVLATNAHWTRPTK